MAKKNQNFETWQGNSESIDVEILKTDGTPLDLTAARLVWAVSKHPDGLQASAVITKDSDVVGEITITDGINGLANIAIVPSDTSALEPYNYYHELKAAPLASSEFKTVLSGKLKLNPSAHWISS